MREKAAAKSDELAPTANPWMTAEAERAAALNVQARPTVSNDERSSQYTDWADRMKAKRERNRDMILNRGVKQDEATYWSTDALFADSKQIEEEELLNRPNPWRIHELLAILELKDDAEPRQVGDAYRKLAKEHHPDRYVSADEETQQFHAEKMASINKAYRALKELQRA
jgi:DnaJ-domain-containing protein 1